MAGDDERSYQRASDKELGRLVGTIEEFMRATRGQVATLFTKIDDLAARAVTRQDLADLERKQDAHTAQDAKEHAEFREMNTTNELTMQALAEKIIGSDEQEGRDGLLQRMRVVEQRQAFVMNGATLIKWISAVVVGSVGLAVSITELIRAFTGH